MKKIGFSFTIILLSIITFELFLRYSPFSYGITPMVYDKDVGMWHKKNFSDYIIKKCYKTKYFFDKNGNIKNNYELDVKKKNIVLLGDSQIEALMVKNENVIHNTLYKETNGKYNILNYGLSGTGPSQHLEILKTKVDLEKIQRLIHFVFLENDLNDGDPSTFGITSRPKVYMNFSDLNTYKIIKPRVYDFKEKIRDILGNFEMYVYLKKTYYSYSSKIKNIFTYKNSKNTSSKTVDKYKISNEEYKWKQLNGSIYQMNKLAHDNNFKYSVILLSSYESNGYIKYRERFEKFLNNQNIEYINIFDFLKKLKNKQNIKFKCDGHWNDMTHKELSKNIVKELSL